MNGLRFRRSAPVGMLLLVLVLGGRPVAASPATYGPVPEDLAAVRGTPSDEALAVRAMKDAEAAAKEGDAPGIREARALLVLLDAVALRHVAARLAAGDVPEDLLPHLLKTVAVSAHPAADTLLARAAQEVRADLRMIAAEGLGWGRTPESVPVLTKLASDPVPGVRIAALRSLFALESEPAVEARMGLARDPRADLHARRLRWHRLRGDHRPALLPVALAGFHGGRSAEERRQAAALLTMPGLGASVEILEAIVLEMGTDPVGAALRRIGRGVTRRGYDPVAMREVAIAAAWVGSLHPDVDAATRARLIDRAVGWVARPVSMDAQEKRTPPEFALKMLLPDLGVALREPILRRLARGGFSDPGQG
ncbi:MAG: HEAT repeat domain-containing protein, partial [Planctomycetota bacterium]